MELYQDFKLIEVKFADIIEYNIPRTETGRNLQLLITFHNLQAQV